jgi:hypothetical protein
LYDSSGNSLISGTYSYENSDGSSKSIVTSNVDGILELTEETIVKYGISVTASGTIYFNGSIHKLRL